MSKKPEDLVATCEGGCHCGAVRFRIDLPKTLQAFRCNCSICKKSGFVHVFVTPEQFHLLSGGDEVIEYQFHTHAARHLFCRHCGVKSYYIPRSHPDGISVNLNCIDLPETVELEIGDFDGARWSHSIEQLRGARGETTDG